jgi:hypothetical protein
MASKHLAQLAEHCTVHVQFCFYFTYEESIYEYIHTVWLLICLCAIETYFLTNLHLIKFYLFLDTYCILNTVAAELSSC